MGEEREANIICVECGAKDPTIFLCDAGWWCESCYRIEIGVPADADSEQIRAAAERDPRCATY